MISYIDFFSIFLNIWNVMLNIICIFVGRKLWYHLSTRVHHYRCCLWWIVKWNNLATLYETRYYSYKFLIKFLLNQVRWLEHATRERKKRWNRIISLIACKTLSKTLHSFIWFIPNASPKKLLWCVWFEGRWGQNELEAILTMQTDTVCHTCLVRSAFHILWSQNHGWTSTIISS